MSGLDTQRALSALRRFTRPEREPARCELCAAPLGPTHAHLFELESRELVCACGTCACLFPSGSDQRRQRVETKVAPLPHLQLNDADWAALDVPVRLVFLSPSKHHDSVYATYPNPQGAVEARLPLRAWNQLTAAHAELAGVAYEVEALVIDGRGERCAVCRVSIDVCHGLVGSLRAHARSATPAWPQLERALADLQRGVHA